MAVWGNQNGRLAGAIILHGQTVTAYRELIPGTVQLALSHDPEN